MKLSSQCSCSIIPKINFISHHLLGLVRFLSSQVSIFWSGFDAMI